MCERRWLGEVVSYQNGKVPSSNFEPPAKHKDTLWLQGLTSLSGLVNDATA